MGLHSYASKAMRFADDLLELLNVEDKDAIRTLFDREGYSLFLEIPDTDTKNVFVFLGKAPAQQARQLAKLSGDARLKFWMRARFLALASADALSIAEIAERHVGDGYRTMHRAIAEAIHPHPTIPTIAGLLETKWD